MVQELPIHYVVRLTSSAPAAIAVLQVVGPRAESWILSHWQQNAASTAPPVINHIRYGMLDATGGSVAGESIVLCKTGNDRFELHCHGGPTASQRIVDQLTRDGFELISPSDLVQSQSTDSIANDATHDLLRASSIRTAAILLDQQRGALRQELDSAVQCLRAREIDRAMIILQTLRDRSRVGLHLVEPWNVVLAGPPNAGKSSLLNAILGYQRAIVHESAGTTRDLLMEQTSIDGWPIRIADSAGVHATEDEVELQGIRSSLQAVAKAECVLLLIAPDEGWTEYHDTLLAQAANKRGVSVLTKSDVSKDLEQKAQSSWIRVSTSVTDPSSISRLLSAISTVLVPSQPPSGSGVPFRIEHVRRIAECISELEVENIDRALTNIETW